MKKSFKFTLAAFAVVGLFFLVAPLTFGEDYDKAAPRITLAPDGSIIFFMAGEDRVIHPDKAIVSREKFEKAVQERGLMHSRLIKVYFTKPGSNCYVYVDLGYAIYCFKIKCETGQYLGSCN